MSTQHRITFLLGAGASIPAGYVSMNHLTELILGGSELTLHSDKTFVRRPPPEPGFPPMPEDRMMPVIRRLLGWLYLQTRSYFVARGEFKAVNYEDIYFAAAQLADDLTELQNPAIQPFMDTLKSDMCGWPEYVRLGLGQPIPDANTLHDTSELACRYIQANVTNKLSGPPIQTGHLALIHDACNNSSLELQGIATLSHDNHVEVFLQGKGIDIADGFSAESTASNYRIWKNKFVNNNSVPFLKLHGSVDWFKLTRQITGSVRRIDRVGKVTRTTITPQGSDPGSVGVDFNRYTRAEDRLPLMLMGTFNKPTQYSRGLMADIHYRFRRILNDTDCLVICGYSFGDKAINNHIIDWLDNGKRVVVIDPKPMDDVIRTARYAAGRFLKSNAAQFITRGIETVSLDDVLRQCSMR